MINFKQFLNEAKQVGILYHITSLYSTINILKTDSMKGGIYKAVSFSRSKNFKGWDSKKHRMTNKFKFEPFKGPRATKEESEERILTDKNNEIKGIKKYIKEIIIFNTYSIASFTWQEEEFNESIKKLKKYAKNIKITITDEPDFTRGYK